MGDIKLNSPTFFNFSHRIVRSSLFLNSEQCKYFSLSYNVNYSVAEWLRICIHIRRDQTRIRKQQTDEMQRNRRKKLYGFAPARIRLGRSLKFFTGTSISDGNRSATSVSILPISAFSFDFLFIFSPFRCRWLFERATFNVSRARARDCFESYHVDALERRVKRTIMHTNKSARPANAKPNQDAAVGWKPIMRPGARKAEMTLS